MRPLKSSVGILTVCLLFLACLSLQTVSAEEYRTFHRGVRPLGMGGAFTAVADDHNARYYNPAGLASSGGFSLGIFNPQISVSENSVDLLSDFEDTDTDDTNEVNNLLQKYLGENNNVKASLDPYVGFKIKNIGMAVTAIASTDINVNVHNPVWPRAYITGVVDTGAMVSAGMAVPLVPGLRVGASLKAIGRNSIDETYDATEIANQDVDFADRIEDDMESGSGFGLDIGVLYSPPDLIPFSDLTVAFTGQNLPNMEFGDAIDTNSQYNLGVALRQKFGIVTLTEALDYMDITDNLTGDESMEKKIHMGVEAKIPILSVRVGINQGYATAGATVDFKMIKLDVATYGEEVGAK